MKVGDRVYLREEPEVRGTLVLISEAHNDCDVRWDNGPRTCEYLDDIGLIDMRKLTDIGLGRKIY